MTEFHKKESEELEKEHDKLYETLDEDRKKVRWISLRQRSVLCTTQSVQWYRHILKNLHDYKFWQILIVFLSQSSQDLRTLHETKVRQLSVCDLEITYASLYGDKVTKL